MDNPFFPYLINTAYWKLGRKMIKNPILLDRTYTSFNIEDFPSGISKVPFRCRIAGQSHNMNLIAGFIGMTEDKESGFLESEINWVVQRSLLSLIFIYFKLNDCILPFLSV